MKAINWISVGVSVMILAFLVYSYYEGGKEESEVPAEA